MTFPEFPSFYAECAFNDGFHDGMNNTSESFKSYVKHGEVETVGANWYHKGLRAAIEQRPLSIDPSHFDNEMHKVKFTVGADFTKKWDAYRADGFTVALGGEDFFLACKLLPHQPIPEYKHLLN